ncbi:unnamed protein product [Dovyalis caffra]|uniref:Gnk2-homologous domain-containing protein n=1 Tax=Dovyalis caffra TaxID=77055 RepID=A0AAV1SKT0_9ROSI|nr:unnamed protein product [Dovyalis caffra]
MGCCVRILYLKGIDVWVTYDVLSSIALITISITEAQEPTYRYDYCPNTTTFVRNSKYEANLNLLLSSLVSNANRNNIGFYNNSAGQDPYDVYGLFLCRGISVSKFV